MIERRNSCTWRLSIFGSSPSPCYIMIMPVVPRIPVPLSDTRFCYWLFWRNLSICIHILNIIGFTCRFSQQGDGYVLPLSVRFFDNTSNLFLQIFLRFVRLKITSKCLQSFNFFTPNFLWLFEIWCLQNKWNILSPWVLKYVSESSDAKITSGGILMAWFFSPIFVKLTIRYFHDDLSLNYRRSSSHSSAFHKGTWDQLLHQIGSLLHGSDIYWVKFKRKYRTCQTEGKTLSHLEVHEQRWTYFQPSFVLIS